MYITIYAIVNMSYHARCSICRSETQIDRTARVTPRDQLRKKKKRTNERVDPKAVIHYRVKSQIKSQSQSNREIVFFLFSFKVPRLRPCSCYCCCCCSQTVSSSAAEGRIKERQSRRPRGRVLAQFTTKRNFKIASHPESSIAQLSPLKKVTTSLTNSSGGSVLLKSIIQPGHEVLNLSTHPFSFYPIRPRHVDYFEEKASAVKYFYV